MYKPKPFIQQQLKSTLIRGFQKTQYLLSYLKNTWILLNNRIFDLARNPNTSTETLELLANDKDSSVRFWVARNPNTPAETLERLANDRDSCVRECVAYNPNTPPEVLEHLANDEDSEIRYEVANNINTPQYIKTYLKIKRYGR
jgi:hypothetical protein